MENHPDPTDLDAYRRWREETADGMVDAAEGQQDEQGNPPPDDAA